MVKIITDSSTLYTQAEAAAFGVEATPLCVAIGDYQGRDLVSDYDDFYDRISKGQHPQSSQPPVGEVMALYEKYKDDFVINIAMADGLSGTYQSACIAAEDFPNIRVVDSMNVSIASGILAEYALRCAAEGMGLDELAEHLTKKRDEVALVAMVDTLEYLRKGGRISGAAALAGGVLNIKPVVTTRDGELAVLGKARGSKKANNLLVEQITRDGVNYSMPLQLGYTGLSDDMLQQYIEDSQALWKGHVDTLDCVQLSSVIGTHAGPGAVAVAYFKSGAVQ
jgi:DegV family protein with EDD domain